MRSSMKARKWVRKNIDPGVIGTWQGQAVRPKRVGLDEIRLRCRGFRQPVKSLLIHLPRAFPRPALVTEVRQSMPAQDGCFVVSFPSRTSPGRPPGRPW